MEPPAAAAPPLQPQYPDSLDSSPRSRNTESWDDPLPPSSRLRLMCSYGGHIVPRPHDKSLCYVGGDTRIVVVDRNTSLSDLSNRLAKTLLNGRPFTLKYQLPSEDLDSLISVTTDEDLDNMIDEFDRTASHNSSAKPARIRLFLFPLKPDSSQSMGPMLDMPTKSEDWFLNALNGSSGMLNRGFSDSASVDCLLGLDDGGGAANNSESRGDAEASAAANCKNGRPDVHSVPDSPMLENSSSFGSTSSSPSLANLPPIRVHVEDGGGGSSHGGNRAQDQKVGIEEQFAQMTVGMVGQQKQDDGGGFVILSSTPPLPTTIMPSSAPVSSSSPPDYLNRVVSDDERSDHGGYRKPIPPQPQQQQSLPPQSQPKSTGLFDLPSPDSVSSDHSLSNVAVSRPKPVVYQEPVAQIPSGTPTRFPANLVDSKVNVSDPNTRVQMQQQVQDSGYVLQNQYDQQLQQQQLLQQQLQQQQQFIHPGAQYMHHHPAGSVPIQAYYPVYPSQQQHHQQQQQQQQQQHHHHQLDQQQQYQVYYMPARQAPPYSNLPLQQSLQSNMSEAAGAATIASSRSQTPPNPMLSPTAAYSQVRNAPIAKSEIAAPVYRTTTTAAPPSLIQGPPSQHQPQQQYVGYAQVHPSQSTVPTSTGAANYAYEYADASHAQHAQIYYTQPPLAHAMTSQYQTMTATAAMGLPEVSNQLPNDNIKQQQQRSQ
ncbi:PREDICTED: putative mediator of RNA polymerase II transcription subunit 12 [Fragaria vesca subsp. vesca]|uniref:putative mediator of RNA polymerase II transcription subunit 12 n=1 Tax=Fragaria vesca subsp. vesca TaxID=101020 RepID=UPI0002C335E3|nr:PREDICTED: putative mediator of RNA polymerase II transcription subunit 12 [Fragaria vesca subsp. vesca]